MGLGGQVGHGRPGGPGVWGVGRVQGSLAGLGLVGNTMLVSLRSIKVPSVTE